MTNLTPREIVSELDRFIIGQNDAKRAVAVAMRNRWRRNQLGDDLRDEVYPKNILMIGPTGVGKTEISRRLAKLARAPFIKVEATKFTEVGYVGRDVEQIIRDLIDVAMTDTRERLREDVRARAEQAAENRVIEAIAGEDARPQTREMFRERAAQGRNGRYRDRAGHGRDSDRCPRSTFRASRRRHGDAQSRRYPRQGLWRAHHAQEDDGGRQLSRC